MSKAANGKQIRSSTASVNHRRPQVSNIQKTSMTNLKDTQKLESKPTKPKNSLLIDENKELAKTQELT